MTRRTDAAEGLPQRRCDLVQGPLPGGGIELPLLGRKVHLVVLAGVLGDRKITPGKHVIQNRRNGLAGGMVGAGESREIRIQRLERRDRQPADH